jgi:putative restriction endonuclease
MSNASKLDREVWDEFFGQMAASLAISEAIGDAAGFSDLQRDFAAEIATFPEGADVVRSVKARVNQDFFRRLVLASYDNRCALTGIDAPGLLVASHIVPWSQNKDTRTTPRNGICLNALHDCAFDQGFLTFTDSFEAIYSDDLPSTARQVLESLGSRSLRLPSRFVPDVALIAFHRQTIFRGRLD